MKLIFLDADGTLFHHEGYVPDSAILACKKKKKRVIKLYYVQEDKLLKFLGICSKLIMMPSLQVVELL